MTETAQHVVCPQCQAVNRLPASRLNDNPICGRCKHHLFVGEPIELTQQSAPIFLQRNDIDVLVDFWAPWCGPCKMMAPQFEQAAHSLEPLVRLAKINTEVEQTLAAQFNIRSIPTLILFRNGQEIARQSGAMNKNDIIRWLSQYRH